MVSVEVPEMMDVAIATADGAVLACAMTENEYTRLAKDWMGAIAHKGGRAGCYWMTVAGQATNHGLLLANIVSLTGVPLDTKSESDV